MINLLEIVTASEVRAKQSTSSRPSPKGEGVAIPRWGAGSGRVASFSRYAISFRDDGDDEPLWNRHCERGTSEAV